MARRRRVDSDLKALRERRYRLRARTTRTIPDADSDFALMAKHFAAYVAEHAERFGVAAEQVEALTQAVQQYRDALARTMDRNTAGPAATARKNEARAKAEKIVRAVANTIRGHVGDALTEVDRLSLNMPARPRKLNARLCPDVAPVLRFVGATHNNHGGGQGIVKHVLEYRNDFGGGRAKPHGAVRLELFTGLVPPEWAAQGRLPSRPDALNFGVGWYLGSYTTHRFEVVFPVAVDGRPMLVLYWGRWADSRGNVGPFSKTCVARVEGGEISEPMYAGAQKPAALPGASRMIASRPVLWLPAAAVQDAHWFEHVHVEDVRMLPAA